MRDGKTRKLERVANDTLSLSEFLESHLAKLVVLSGPNAGVSFPLETERVTMGRGPGVDIVLHDEAMSRQHAAVDFTSDGFRIQDLGSTNGLLLDDRPVQTGTLSHGSRFTVGEHVFQLVIEEREPAVDVYELPTGS